MALTAESAEQLAAAYATTADEHAKANSTHGTQQAQAYASIAQAYAAIATSAAIRDSQVPRGDCYSCKATNVPVRAEYVGDTRLTRCATGCRRR